MHCQAWNQEEGRTYGILLYSGREKQQDNGNEDLDYGTHLASRIGVCCGMVDSLRKFGLGDAGSVSA